MRKAGLRRVSGVLRLRNSKMTMRIGRSEGERTRNGEGGGREEVKINWAAGDKQGTYNEGKISQFNWFISLGNDFLSLFSQLPAKQTSPTSPSQTSVPKTHALLFTPLPLNIQSSMSDPSVSSLAPGDKLAKLTLSGTVSGEVWIEVRSSRSRGVITRTTS